MMRACFSAWLLVLLTLAGCNTKSTDPVTGGPPTLLVRNATCATGPCVPLNIRAWIPKFVVPGQPPTGFLSVGTARGASTCLEIPFADTLRVYGVDSMGHVVDSTLTIWTVYEPFGLTASVGSPFSPPLGVSTTFVPMSAPGWRITFPNSGSLAEPTASPRCTP